MMPDIAFCIIINMSPITISFIFEDTKKIFNHNDNNVSHKFHKSENVEFWTKIAEYYQKYQEKWKICKDTKGNLTT